MSLINDVLRDLDRRGATPPLPGIATRIPPRARRRSGWLLALLAAAVLLPAIGGWIWQYRLREAGVSQPAPDAPRPAVAAAVPDAEPTPVATVEAPRATSGETSDAPAASARPAADNTLERTPALAAMPTADRSSRMPVAPVADPQRPPESSSPATAAPIAARSADRSTRTLAAPPPGPTIVATDPVDPAVADPTDDLPVNQAVQSSAPAAVADAGRIEIRRRTPASAATDDIGELIHAADAARAARRSDEAERLLRLVLAQAPAQHRARHALARELDDGGRRIEAIALLEDGLRRDPRAAVLAELLGRWRLESGDPVRAAAVLAAAVPPLTERPSHHALLAAAWQQAGEPAQAAPIWRALLRHDATVGSWWLGLAVAEDALGRRDAAREAFAQARRDRTLEDGVIRYVEQRMRQLGPGDR